MSNSNAIRNVFPKRNRLNQESTKFIPLDQTHVYGGRDNFGMTISKMSKSPKFQDAPFRNKGHPPDTSLSCS